METPGIEPGASRMRIERSTTELHPHEHIVASFRQLARLAEWSKAQDLSSCNRKIAWVRTPHLAGSVFFNWLQWRNRLAHGTYRQYIEKCRGCEFEPHLEQYDFSKVFGKKVFHPTMTGLEPAIPRSEVWCLIH